MIKKLSQSDRRNRRHRRLRKHVSGTSRKPRMSIFRSQKHIYIQLIDDTQAKTLVSANSLEDIKLPEAPAAAPVKETPVESKGQEKGKKKGAKAEAKEQPELKKPSLLAQAVGELAAKRALEKGIAEVVFDRGGFQFHGRVKAAADGARKAGLKF